MINSVFVSIAVVPEFSAQRAIISCIGLGTRDYAGKLDALIGSENTYGPRAGGLSQEGAQPLRLLA
jgi:hypothetical protein